MKKIAICLSVLWLAASAYGFDPEDIRIHGFVSQGYLRSDKNDFSFAGTEDGTFQFNEMGISFATEPTDRLRLGMQFLSRDLGQLGNNEIEIAWAFADYHHRDWLGLRAGKIKRPYGLYNRSRDVDAARPFVLLPAMAYDEVPRETYAATTGVAVYGRLACGLSYEFQYGTMQIEEDGGVAKNMEWLLGATVTRMDADGNGTAYLEWATPFEGLTVAGTAFLVPAYTAETDMGSLDVEADSYVASLEYVHGNLTLSAEYVNLLFEFTLNDTLKIADQTSEDWYAGFSYQFNDWFALGGYYGESYPDKDDRAGESYEAQGLPAALAWKKELALTTRFDIGEHWIFKLEGHLMDGLVQVTTPPQEADEDWFLFAAKMTFSF